MTDNKAEKYYTLSPYIYAANNPIRFLDPDGNKIVDATGNVIYTQEKGWSKNASQGAQRIQLAMNTTSIGRQQWNKMVNSDNKISLNIVNKNTLEDRDATLGQTFVPRSKDKETGNNKFRADVVIKVEIYEKTITDNTMTKGQVNEGLTVLQALGATAAHEAEHATNQQNINDTIDNTNMTEGQDRHDVEALPTSIGNQAREESRMKPIKRKEAFLTSGQ